MLSNADIEIMATEEFRQCVLHNIERDPVVVALDKRVQNASLVATQVKYLQRAKYKLPRLYSAGCIIPPRAFEQSSSEYSADVKAISGGTLLDLTCGLGIDTMSFAERFDRVVALERDEVLARVVRYNLGLLGIKNVEVVTTTAEEYLSQCEEHFDWVFVDPDRRSAEGKKMVRMEDCSPNVLEQMSNIERVANRLGVKLSPLFDVEEARRLFPCSEVEVVSIAGECKELNVYTKSPKEMLRIVIAGVGVWEYDFEVTAAQHTITPLDVEGAKYLIIPDVAMQKGRVAVAEFSPYAQIWSNNGYAFASVLPEEKLPAKVYEIERIERYNPKQLKKEFKGKGVEILKRDTQLSIDAVRKATSMRAGSEHMMAITAIGSDIWVVHIKK
ncbi:MAG: RsmD family RNA methyltransferase [Alistipes sp.]|nr:RsmD family RNA methyltransferase [Alistipes sp.]